METSLDDPFPTVLLNMMADMPVSFFLINGLVILVLLGLSGLVSGSEVAFFSFTHNQIKEFNASPDMREKRISQLLHHPKRLLATILILNNLVNIFIVTISTFATWQIVGDEGKQGITIVILTSAITLLIIFFGEIIPKVYANHNGTGFAKLTSGLLMLSYRLFKPISWFLMTITGLIERRMEKKGYNLSVEEINQALEISVEKEEVSEEEKGILKGIVNFGTLSVKQVMKARMDITAVDIETDFHELMNQINKTGYSRIPIFTKGPRLSCELSLAGRYLVMVPFSNTVNVSKKITDANERKRLQRLISSIKPEGFGVIIRTVAQGKDVKELDTDLRNLVDRWDEGMKALRTAKPKDKVIGEMNRANSILRDVLNESFDSIQVDDKDLYQEIKTFVKGIAPDKEKILRQYTGKAKIFEATGVEKQLKTSFGQSVSMLNGGYLIIEHTEALHVIDVNSGNKSNKEDNQEDTALKVNLDAADEIARQLRLRDMGGIIVIDFIDMRRIENKKKLFAKMKEAMKEDRSKHTILPLSKFGLMEITRQRVRPELSIATKEVCPTCSGTGKISASIQVADQVENTIKYFFESQNEKKITVALHPYLYTYFTAGIFSRRVKWFLKYFRWVNMVEDSSKALTEFEVLNAQGEPIQI